jgi:hypothetical protein
MTRSIAGNRQPHAGQRPACRPVTVTGIAELAGKAGMAGITTADIISLDTVFQDIKCALKVHRT